MAAAGPARNGGCMADGLTGRVAESTGAQPARSGLVVPALTGGPRAGLCTDCGLSRVEDGKACGRACQFIAPDYEKLESRVHGRAADPAQGDEMFFGVTVFSDRAALSRPADGAQWTGITTALAEQLLRRGKVSAVLTVAPDAFDRWKPVPVLVTDADAMPLVRGMRMGWAPTLALLKPAAEAGHRRIALIGIPCQVHALRAIEAELGFERIYVIGTPCSDNTTTENFHQFLKLVDPEPDAVTYLEFRADYRVEMRYDDGRKPRTVPFLKLPLSKLPADFFPMTCKTCVDYTNRLADVTVGYMAGGGAQWVVARNARGAEMLADLGPALERGPLTDKGKRQGAVRGFLANTARAAGGLPLRAMPDWARPIVAFLQPRIGPRGLEFARARVEMKAIETVLHLRRAFPARIKNMVPAHVWRLVAPYGLHPTDAERKSGQP